MLTKLCLEMARNAALKETLTSDLVSGGSGSHLMHDLLILHRETRYRTGNVTTRFPSATARERARGRVRERLTHCLPVLPLTHMTHSGSLCPFRCGSSRSVSGSGRGRGRRQRNRQRRRRQLCSCVNAFLQPPRRCTDPILVLKDLVTAQRQAAAIEAERKRKREASERESRKPARLPAPGASWFTDVGPRM